MPSRDPPMGPGRFARMGWLSRTFRPAADDGADTAARQAPPVDAAAPAVPAEPHSARRSAPRRRRARHCCGTRLSRGRRPIARSRPRRRPCRPRRRDASSPTGRYGPLVCVTRFDTAPPELEWQLPLNGELYRLMPGSDRPDYSLLVLERPLHFYPRDGFDLRSCRAGAAGAGPQGPDDGPRARPAAVCALRRPAAAPGHGRPRRQPRLRHRQLAGPRRRGRLRQDPVRRDRLPQRGPRPASHGRAGHRGPRDARHRSRADRAGQPTPPRSRPRRPVRSRRMPRRAGGIRPPRCSTGCSTGCSTSWRRPCAAASRSSGVRRSSG